MVDVPAAFERAGKLLDVSTVTRTVTGRVKYGLQRVKLRVAVHDGDATSCTLEIQAFADDIWGGGARKGTDRLIAALDEVAR
jgi:hypothetical protein